MSRNLTAFVFAPAVVVFAAALAVSLDPTKAVLYAGLVQTFMFAFAWTVAAAASVARVLGRPRLSDALTGGQLPEAWRYGVAAAGSGLLYLIILDISDRALLINILLTDESALRAYGAYLVQRQWPARHLLYIELALALTMSVAPFVLPLISKLNRGLSARAAGDERNEPGRTVR